MGITDPLRPTTPNERSAWRRMVAGREQLGGIETRLVRLINQVEALGEALGDVENAAHPDYNPYRDADPGTLGP